MTLIESLIADFKKDSRCKVLPVINGLPSLPDVGFSYPTDLVEFYNQCGGVILFESGKDNVSFKILSPSEILQANMVIVGEVCEDDISSAWYLICQTDNGDYLSIDLSKERNGRCYDSNYEVHGVVGSCPIISLSFTELLSELYKTNGRDIYWKNKDYGDAYT